MFSVLKNVISPFSFYIKIGLATILLAYIAYLNIRIVSIEKSCEKEKSSLESSLRDCKNEAFEQSIRYDAYEVNKLIDENDTEDWIQHEDDNDSISTIVI